MTISASTAAGVKPSLRGVPDLIATALTIPAAIFLISMAPSGVSTVAAVTYTLSLVCLFAMSTTYHLPMWSPSNRRRLRRFDHAAIYVLIAGTYTPACLTVFEPSTGYALLAVVWGIALLGIAKALFVTRAPRWLNAAIYVCMGWLILPFVPELWSSGGPYFVVMLTIGGALYTVGAAIYARRWLNISPAVFGYHEVFHLFVIGAAACHYTAVWSVLV